MRILTDQKIITCILPRGKGIEVMRRLKTDKGIVEGYVNTARGMGKLSPGVHRGLGEQTEKEILDVIVDSGQAEEIFEYLYETAEIDQPHGGIIFMAKVQQVTPYLLPHLR